MSLNLSWIKCDGGLWCDLGTVNLDHPNVKDVKGVYLIWHRGSPPQYVKVGHGNVSEALKGDRDSQEVQAFADEGLNVTWAAVPDAQIAGVQCFLAENLEPLVECQFENVVPIVVNLP